MSDLIHDSETEQNEKSPGLSINFSTDMNTIKSVIYCCVISFCYPPRILYAIERLPDMVITSPWEALESKINHPDSIENSQVNAMHYRSLAEVLQGSPGLSFVKYGGYGQAGSLAMRGAGGQGLLMLDDIPVLFALPGSLEVDGLPSETIQSVAVQRGPEQAYRSFQALGGAVRLYSADSHKSGIGISTEGGSFGILRETLKAAIAGSAGRLTLSASRGDAFDGGYAADSRKNPERDPFHYTQTLLRFNTDINQRINWQGSFLYRQSFVGADKFALDPQRHVTVVDDANSYGTVTTWMGQNTLNVDLTPTWSSHLQLGFTQIATDTKSGPYLNGVFSRLLLVNWRNEHRLIDNTENGMQWQLIWGGQGRHEQGSEPISSFKQERSMASAFIETTAQYGRLSGDVGIRFEHYDYFGDHPLFRSAVAWKINSALTLRMSGGTGIRIPSYTEMLFLFYGNPNLKPERSASGELAFEWHPVHGLELNLKGYYYRYTDLILGAVSLVAGPATQNISRAATTGMELNVRFNWNQYFESGANYTYNDIRDLTTHRPLPFRPHSAKVWGEWRMSDYPISLRAEAYYQNGTWNDLNQMVPVKGAEQINVIARYLVSSNLEFHLRGENLTNNRSAQVYRLDKPGIMVFGGFQLRF